MFQSMTLSHPLRILAIAMAVAFGVGCGGGSTSMMQPQVAQSDVPAEIEAAETSCAGDVCFTYAGDAD